MLFLPEDIALARRRGLARFGGGGGVGTLSVSDSESSELGARFLADVLDKSEELGARLSVDMMTMKRKRVFWQIN